MEIHNSWWTNGRGFLTEQKTNQEKQPNRWSSLRSTVWFPAVPFTQNIFESVAMSSLFPVCAPCFLSQSDLCACSSGDALVCYLATVSTATKLLHVSPPPRLRNKSLVFLCCFVSTSFSPVMRQSVFTGLSFITVIWFPQFHMVGSQMVWVHSQSTVIVFDREGICHHWNPGGFYLSERAQPPPC